jgi:hypothetical protein
MPSPIWSWALTVIGATFLWLIGSGKWWGWAGLIVNECLWVVYAVATRQYGFIVAALLYGAMDARNLFAARRGASIPVHSELH